MKARARQAGGEASPNATQRTLAKQSCALRLHPLNPSIGGGIGALRSKWLQDGTTLHRDTMAVARSLLGLKARLPSVSFCSGTEMCVVCVAGSAGTAGEPA